MKTRQATNDQTTDDPKKIVGISLPQSLIDRIKSRAKDHDRSFSSMCAHLLRSGLVNLDSTGN